MNSSGNEALSPLVWGGGSPAHLELTPWQTLCWGVWITQRRSTGSGGIICSLRNLRPRENGGLSKSMQVDSTHLSPICLVPECRSILSVSLGVALHGQAVAAGSGLETWSFQAQVWGDLRNPLVPPNPAPLQVCRTPGVVPSCTVTELSLSALYSEPWQGRPHDLCLVPIWSRQNSSPPPAASHRFLLPQNGHLSPLCHLSISACLLGLDVSPLLLTCYHEHGTMNLGVTLQKRSVESEGARSMSHGESGLLCSDQAFLGPHCNLQWEGLREEDHTCFVSSQGSQLGTVGRREWDRCLLGIYSMPGPLSRLLNPRSRRWW